MTKYELLKETVGCRPIVINCIHSLEDDLYEAEKMLKLPYSLVVKDKGVGHYRKKAEHYKEIINDLKLIVSEIEGL